MEFAYKTKGVCCQNMYFELNDGIVTNVRFDRGCNGNLKGIAALVEGMKAEDIIARCEGVKCGMKSTSCPDQFAQALKEALNA